MGQCTSVCETHSVQLCSGELGRDAGEKALLVGSGGFQRVEGYREGTKPSDPPHTLHACYTDI